VIWTRWCFVAVAQALEDFDGFLVLGGSTMTIWKAAFEGAVLLDVLAVLVERGRADALDLAAREGRLEHVGGVDGALPRRRLRPGCATRR
jgi:hypothetical protein